MYFQFIEYWKICRNLKSATKKKCSNEPPIGKRIAVLFVKLVLTINILILYLKQHRTLRMYRIKQITLYIDLPTRPFSPLLEYVRNLIISSQKMIQKSNSNWFDQIFSKRCSKCQSEFNKINFEHSY